MRPTQQNARESETTGKGAPKMRKQRETKEDGRYIIFYEFGEGEKQQRHRDGKGNP